MAYDAEDEMDDAQTSGVVGLDDVLRPRRSRRAALLRSSAVGLALIVAVAVLVHPAIMLPGDGARPIPPSSAGETQTPVVALHTNVNFGLALNGKPLTLTEPAQMVPVWRGKNTLSFNAAPFAPIACSFTWPLPKMVNIDFSQRCVGIGSIEGTGTTGSVTVVNFPIFTEDLPATLRPGLTSRLTQALDALAAAAAMPVPAGDAIPYALDAQGVPQSRFTAQPLLGQPTITIGAVNAFDGCQVQICPGDISFSPPGEIPQPVIAFTVATDLGWRFTDRTGRLVANVPLTAHRRPGDTFITLTLRYDANAQTLTPDLIANDNQVEENFCSLGVSALSALMEIASKTFESLSSQSAADNNGCLITVTTTLDNSPVMANFVERFGALLVGDDAAHRLAPSLPRAPADEVRAVTGG